MAEISIEIPGKAISLNRLSGMSHWQTTNEKKMWREAAYLLAKKYQPLEPLVDIEITLFYKGRMTDSISCAYAAKAGTDGIVDAGIIPDDSPKYVRDLIIRQPQKGDRDMLWFKVIEVPERGI